MHVCVSVCVCVYTHSTRESLWQLHHWRVRDFNRQTPYQKRFYCVTVNCKLFHNNKSSEAIMISSVSGLQYLKSAIVPVTNTHALMIYINWYCNRNPSREAAVLHCNTLQHTAAHCNWWQHTAVHGNRFTLQHIATHCNVLHHTATHCNTLQHTAAHGNKLQHTATHGSIRQHTATHCTMLQYTTINCDTLHHTAQQCNTLQ